MTAPRGPNPSKIDKSRYPYDQERAFTLPAFNVTEDYLVQEAEGLARDTLSLQDELALKLALGKANYTNVLLPLALQDNENKARTNFIASFQSLSPNEQLRNASSKAINIIDKTYLDFFMRKDIFGLLNAVGKKREDLGIESARLLEKWIENFIENGLHLPTSDSRERFQHISSRLIELRVKFMQNLTEDRSILDFERSELEGLPQNILRLFEVVSGRLRMPLKRGHVAAVLRYCSVAESRKRVFMESERICAGNTSIFNEALSLRRELASLLGYDSYASFRLSSQMPGSKEVVDRLLVDLRQGLASQRNQELSQLAEAKCQDMSNGMNAESISAPVYLWDFPYYKQKLQKSSSDDAALFRDYFPAEPCVRNMLHLFEDLFNISFIELSGPDLDGLSPTGLGEDCLWHPSVIVFRVHDGADKGASLGYLYIDIYSREGKYNHNAKFNICPGYIDANGRRRLVLTALVCNMSQPNESMPCLLQHREVVTLFHELGHAIHDLLSKTQYAYFHGTLTSRDFIEAPSQLLEYWCYDSTVLQRLSCHYAHVSESCEVQWRSLNPETAFLPPKQLSEEMAYVLSTTKQNKFRALTTLGQVAHSIFDMQVHGVTSAVALADMDICTLWADTRRDVQGLAGLEGEEDRVNGHVVTSHLMWGQDAGYYSYLWSKAFAVDMWHTVFAKDPMNKEAGMRYRRMVLEKGGAQDEMKALTDFLGRPPNNAALRYELGLG